MTLEEAVKKIKELTYDRRTKDHASTALSYADGLDDALKILEEVGPIAKETKEFVDSCADFQIYYPDWEKQVKDLGEYKRGWYTAMASVAERAIQAQEQNNSQSEYISLAELEAWMKRWGITEVVGEIPISPGCTLTKHNRISTYFVTELPNNEQETS